MKSLKAWQLATTLALAGITAQPATAATPTYAHVLLISIDGMHAVDLANILADPANRTSALFRLSRNGVVFQNAFTTAPSDSFPGMLAQATGGTPKSTGVFYDDSFDRVLFAPGSNCLGAPGTETAYAENLDRNQSRLDAGGTLGQPLTQINAAALPMSNASGSCKPFFPHEFVRVNTIFEVIKAAGKRTAWSDKHPAYEILNGPSGAGIDDLFTPEINSLLPGGGGVDNTKAFTGTQRYDAVKVRAVLHWIDGLTSIGKPSSGMPAILGMNFQSVSVGQKLGASGPTDPPGLVGGYKDSAGTPNTGLASAIHFVNRSIGAMLRELKVKGHADDTLVIVSAKHGQSPIDPTLLRRIDGAPYAQTPGYGFTNGDDVALTWLKPATQKAEVGAAYSYLIQQSQALGIAQLLTRASLTALYNDPQQDSRTPDFISVVQQGVVYTTGSKIAEHGGFSSEDRNVMLLVSAPNLRGKVISDVVTTTQIAPTILSVLGLDPRALQAVRKEGTRVLPHLFD